MKTNNTKLQYKKGFTLIEIMVSVAIFTIIMTIGMGSLVNLVSTYRIAEQEKKVHDSVNYAMETISREARLGQNYRNWSNPRSLNSISDTSLLSGDDGSGETNNSGNSAGFGFLASDDRGYLVFYLENGALIRAQFDPITGSFRSRDTLTDRSQVEITNFSFLILGTERKSVDGDLNQPFTLLRIQAKAGVASENNFTTDVQTIVSQRILDF